MKVIIEIDFPNAGRLPQNVDDGETKIELHLKTGGGAVATGYRETAEYGTVTRVMIEKQ